MNLFTFKNKSVSPLSSAAQTAGHKLSEQERIAWLRLARTENVGPVTFYRLLERFGSAEKAIERLPDLARKGGRVKPLTAPPLTEVEKEYAALKKAGGDIVTAADDFYPLALSALDDAPPVLSFIGRAELFNQSCVAIVGARNASLNGRKFSETLARDLGKNGQIVVSGLARGIDTAAHTGALSSGTIAVVAGGIDVIYPEENKVLYQQICENGLIVAESPFGVPPIAQSFPRRNRIVSGLSKGVVVVEATLRSGSLITARLAGEQGRDVYAVPGHPLDPRAEGPNHLIREGATLIRSADDVMESLRNFSGQTLRDAPQPVLRGFDSIRDDAERQNDMDAPPDAAEIVLGALSYSPVNIDLIVRETGMPVSTIYSVLLELELAGRVKHYPGGKVALI